MPPVVQSKGASETFSATASPVTTYPSGIAADDLLYTSFVASAGTPFNASGTPPTGWTKLTEIDVGSGLSSAVFWKRADGSESGTVTWTSIFDTSESGVALMWTVRGALASGDPHAGSATETTTTGTAKDTASATPSADDCLALAVMGRNASRTFTWDAGITEEYDQDTTPDSGGTPGFWVASKQLTGAPATSLGGDASGSCATAELIFFIRPAAGGASHTGAASLSLTATVTTTATRTTFAASAASLVFAAASVASRTTFAQAATPLVLSAGSAGTRTTFGAASVPIVFGAATSGGGAASHTGAASLTVTFGSTTTATRTATAAASLPLVAGTVTSATRTATAAATLPLTFTAASAGTLTTFGTATLPIVLGISSSGQVGETPASLTVADATGGADAAVTDLSGAAVAVTSPTGATVTVADTTPQPNNKPMPQITHYDVGDYWQPQATFTVGGTATDPTTLTVKQQAPDGTETTIASAVDPAGLNSSSSPVAKTGTGVFKLNPGVAITSAGRWYVKFTGTGTAAASETHEAIGDPDPFESESGIGTRALVTLAEAKDWLNQQQITTSEDLELVRVINDISQRFIDEAGGREFKVAGTNPQTRFFEPTSRYEVAVGDMASAPTLVRVLHSDWSTVVDTVDTADFLTLPVTRESWEPITRLRFNSHRVASLRGGYRVEVTGSFGFPAVPGNVRQAVLEAISATLDRDVEHYRTDLGPQTSGEGTTVVADVGRPWFLTMPPSALAVARMYAAPLAA